MTIACFGKILCIVKEFLWHCCVVIDTIHQRLMLLLMLMRFGANYGNVFILLLYLNYSDEPRKITEKKKNPGIKI